MKKRASTTAIGWVAFAVSAATFVGMVFTILGVSGPGAYSATFGALPSVLQLASGLLLVALPLGVVAGIVLCIVAGARGRPNRRLGLIGGVLLIAPGIFFLIEILLSQ
jgi:hypothetical protein